MWIVSSGSSSALTTTWRSLLTRASCSCASRRCCAGLRTRLAIRRRIRCAAFYSTAGDSIRRPARLTDSAGKDVALSGAEYRLLAVLLGSANRVLSRAQLTELLRGREADPFDRSIDVRVSRLRQILGDDARAPQIIKTVYGEGYVVGVTVEAQ